VSGKTEIIEERLAAGGYIELPPVNRCVPMEPFQRVFIKRFPAEKKPVDIWKGRSRVR
jgi:hypothetical protein